MVKVLELVAKLGTQIVRPLLHVFVELIGLGVVDEVLGEGLAEDAHDDGDDCGLGELLGAVVEPGAYLQKQTLLLSLLLLITSLFLMLNLKHPVTGVEYIIGVTHTFLQVVFFLFLNGGYFLFGWVFGGDKVGVGFVIEVIIDGFEQTAEVLEFLL